jgi:hypothetical protein
MSRYSEGVAATTGLFLYLNTALASKLVVSWRASFCVLAGFLVYFFGLYVFAYLGIFSIYHAVTGATSLWNILFGSIWMALSYRMLNQFYLITEMVKRR